MIDLIEKNGSDASLLNREFERYVDAHGISDPIPFRDLATTEFMRTYQYPINSWPFFVSPAFVADMQEMNGNILRITHAAIRGIFNDDPERMAAAMGMDAVRCSLFLSKLNLSDICFRTDAVLTEQGLKLVEVNVGTSIGGWQIQWMDETFRNYPGYRGFFDKHSVSCRNTPVTFFRFLIESAARIEDHGTRVILFKVKEGFDPALYGEFLQQCIDEAVAASGVDAQVRFFASFDALEVTPQGTFHDGDRIHLVTFGDLSGEAPAPVQLLRSVLAGKLACPDFPTNMVLSDKRAMALLHYAVQAGALPTADAELVTRYVPRTFMLGGPLYRADLMDELLARKDDYVVKQCDGMQGIDVYVGRFMNMEDWTRKLATLERQELWIAQEYCESVRFYGHAPGSRQVFDFVWGVFQFGDRFGGSWIRMMPNSESYDGVINSARGAQERIVFEAAC
ncbi:hypothetical protein [Xanthomonas medicagonis]|uniref:hypothetical protein n=1 Tax=Xanthomonas medicagonis TaxID=3160841 RepID=UPI003511E97D